METETIEPQSRVLHKTEILPCRRSEICVTKTTASSLLWRQLPCALPRQS
jgi:hypothetical protein